MPADLGYGDTIESLGYTLEGEIYRYFKKNTTYPPICASLRRSELTPIDLSPTNVASVAFSMRNYLDPYATPKVYEQACAISNPTYGQVCYNWQYNDLSSVGVYTAQFKIYYNATVFDGSTTSGLGKRITEIFPTNTNLLVVVSEVID